MMVSPTTALRKPSTKGNNPGGAFWRLFWTNPSGSSRKLIDASPMIIRLVRPFSQTSAAWLVAARQACLHGCGVLPRISCLGLIEPVTAATFVAAARDA